jgi:hypothetical protein
MKSATPVDVSSLKHPPHDEWVSYDKYKSSVVGIPTANPSSASVQADTRNENVINEFLQIFEDPIDQSSSLSPRVSVLSMHGRNGVGGNYSCDLPNTETSTQTIIGKRLFDDWWVKATNVRFPYNLEDEYFLLSYSEGFNFKNKLMLREEFEDTYQQDLIRYLESK